MAHYWCPFGNCTIENKSNAGSQTFPYPSNNSGFKCVPFKFRDENVGKDDSKGFGEFNVKFFFSILNLGGRERDALSTGNEIVYYKHCGFCCSSASENCVRKTGMVYFKALKTFSCVLINL